MSDYSLQEKRVFYALLVGVVLPLIDTTLINLAVPTIQADLNASLHHMQWVVALFNLSAASSLIFSAWLNERFLPRHVWLFCLSLFTFVTAMVALAPQIWVLMVVRAIQGACIGIMLPTMQTLVAQLVGVKRMKGALATLSIPAVLAPLIAPVLGGGVLAIGHWSWLFAAQIPFCLLAIGVAYVYLPKAGMHNLPSKRRLDWFSALLLCLAMLTLSYGLNSIHLLQGQLFVAIGVVCIALYYVNPITTSTPLFAPALVKNPVFLCRLSLVLIGAMFYYGGVFYYPLVLQAAEGGFGVEYASAALMIQALGVLVGRQGLKWERIDRYGDAQQLVVSLAAACLLTIALVLIPTDWVIVWLSVMGVRGIAVGVLTIVSLSYVYKNMPDKLSAQVSTLSRLATYLGAAVIVCLGNG